MFVLHKNSKKDLSSALSEGEILIDYTIDETTAYTLINRNGTEEYGDLFAVFEAEGNTWKRVYENDFKNLMPWKIDLADIDGDDFPEIMIALRKATPFDKEIKTGCSYLIIRTVFCPESGPVQRLQVYGESFMSWICFLRPDMNWYL